MRKRNILNSPRLLELKRGRRKVFFTKILLSLTALLLVFGSLSYIFRLEQLNITSVEITGTKVLDGATIKMIAEERIAGHYLWNVLFYPKDAIKKDLFEKFKRLKSTEFSVNGQRILRILITEREAKYLWCGQFANLEGEQQCYFMDEVGYIFDEAPYFSGEVYFKLYGEAREGSYFAPLDFNQLISFRTMLEEIGLRPAALAVGENGDSKIFLSSKNEVGAPEIIFKTDSDFLKIAENLQAALATEPLLSRLKNNYSSLLYIDLRYGNKVYYKFNN